MQNRVDPMGNIINTKARGAWMGNRGQLHDDTKQILRPFKLKAWLICVLQFKGRHREVMAPRLYTELFFFDEATAFAAGHRPCCECRRQDHYRLKMFWLKGNPEYNFNANSSIKSIDEVMHSERINSRGNKVTWLGNIDDLPAGTFIFMNNEPCLVAGRQLFRWTPAGYDQRLSIPINETVTVLTPRSVVNAFRAGYLPQMSIDGAI